ncbi:MAG: hypothetical protein ACR2MO_08550 [Acidimicrobiales bacterium]
MADDLEARIDPGQSNFIAIFGRKGSGKSVLAHRLWDTWPYDRLVIDPTGDVEVDEDTTALTTPLPTRWPRRADSKRVSLRLVPNRLDPSYRDDLDRAVGLAFFHRRTLLWIDEVGELTRANATPPHFDMALHQGRHQALTLVMCGPRPINVSPLVISQADYVYVFELPNPVDRARVADNIGWEPKDFDALVVNLPEHGYLRWDARQRVLDVFPPIPLHTGRPRRPPVEAETAP